MNAKLYESHGGLGPPFMDMLGGTVRLEVHGAAALRGRRLAGYWQEDGAAMVLLLRALAHRGQEVAALVAPGPEGDTTEAVLTGCGIRAERIPLGATLQSLKRLALAAEGSGLLAAALDGPPGSFHRLAKLPFRLAHCSGREVVQLRFAYSAAAHPRRGEGCAVPLPFSHISVRVEPVGAVSAEDLLSFGRMERRLWQVGPLPAPGGAGIVKVSGNVV